MDELQIVKTMYFNGDTINEIKSAIKKTTYHINLLVKQHGLQRAPGFVKKRPIHPHEKLSSNKKKSEVKRGDFAVVPYPEKGLMKTFEFDCWRLIKLNNVYGVAKLRGFNE